MTDTVTDDAPEVLTPEEEVPEPRQGWRPVTAVVTLAVLVAGGLWNPYLVATVVALLAVIAVHEYGHLLVARRAGMYAPEYMVGFGPTIWSTRRGETTWGLKAVPLGGYVRIVGMSTAEQLDEELEPRAYRSRPWRWRVAVSAAGPVANLLLAVLLLTVVLGVYGQVVPDGSATVGSVATEVTRGTPSPAAAAGLRAGDVVVAVDGQRVRGWDQLVRDVLNSGGDPMELTVERNGSRRTITVDPVRLQGRWVLGVQQGVTRERLSPPAAVAEAVTTTGRTSLAAVQAVGGLAGRFDEYVRDLVSGREVDQRSRFLSPIGASHVAESMSRNGVADVIGLAALVNIMLAVFNLMPVPPLDGGHILVATIEKLLGTVRRREVRIPAKVLAPVSYSVWALLMLVGLSAVWLDIVSPVQM